LDNDLTSVGEGQIPDNPNDSTTVSVRKLFPGLQYTLLTLSLSNYEIQLTQQLKLTLSN